MTSGSRSPRRGSVVALTIVTKISRYFIAEIRRRQKQREGYAAVVADPRTSADAQKLRRCAHGPGAPQRPRLDRLQRHGGRTLVVLCSLAWYRDVLGTHHGSLWSIAALAGAGATIPIVSLMERELRLRLDAVGVKLEHLQ